MIKYLDKKVTANELAKLVAWDKGVVGTEYWDENCCVSYNEMTEREIDAVNEAMARQAERLRDFFGIDALAVKRELFNTDEARLATHGGDMTITIKD